MIILPAAHSETATSANKFGAGSVPLESVVFGVNFFGAIAFKFSAFINRRTTQRPTSMPDLFNAALIRREP